MKNSEQWHAINFSKWLQHRYTENGEHYKQYRLTVWSQNCWIQIQATSFAHCIYELEHITWLLRSNG